MFNGKPENLVPGAVWKPSAALHKPRRSSPPRTMRVLVYLAALIGVVLIYEFISLWRGPTLLGVRPAILVAGGIVVLLVSLRIVGRLIRAKPKEPDNKSQLHL